MGIMLAKVNTLLISQYEIKLMNKQFERISQTEDGQENIYYRLKKLPVSRAEKLTYEILLYYKDYAIEIHCLFFAILAFIIFYKHKIQKPIDYLNSYSIGNMTAILLDEDNELSNACKKMESYTKDLQEEKIKVWRQYDAFNHMISSIGHDIRTPLTILRGNQEMLRILEGENYQHKKTELLDSMEKQIQRIQQYIEKINNLQSIDELVIKKKQISLMKFISTLEQVGNVLSEGRRVHWIKPKEDVSIEIDPAHIQEAFENIMNNAFQYAKENVYVEFHIDDKELKILIQDDGPGFTEEALKYGTSPFFCENNVKGHMGLGLNISNIILKKHGGMLKIYNTKCGGAAEIIIIL